MKATRQRPSIPGTVYVRGGGGCQHYVRNPYFLQVANRHRVTLYAA